MENGNTKIINAEIMHKIADDANETINMIISLISNQICIAASNGEYKYDYKSAIISDDCKSKIMSYFFQIGFAISDKSADESTIIAIRW